MLGPLRSNLMRFATAAPLGSGATGEVLEAWDPALERKIALKLLHRDNPEAAEAMLREARAQARVDHPNVGKVYEVGELDGRPYIAMQLVEGGPLDEALSGRSVERKVRVLQTVAEAVQAAHSAGLIHRDLKPANILVEEDEDGELIPYVLDFGIAREHELPGATRTGQMVGTPGYLSPEQARGERRAVDRRSDVFSLGVILYQLLSGRLPFEADSAVETVLKLLQDEPVPLRKAAPAVSTDLATVVSKCLERDPARRYDSAACLAKDLGRWLAGEPIEARPLGPLPRLARRARRHPVATAALTVAALTILAASTGLAVQQQRARERQLAAQRFGQETERIRTTLRRERSLPLHDVRAVQDDVRVRLGAITARLDTLPDAARGPALLALGQGYLALGEPQPAADILDRAWSRDDRTPDVAYARGLALGALYRRELDGVRRLTSETAQQRARADLERRLLEPTLAMLDAAQGSVDSTPAYLAAQIAYFEERPDAAVEHAEAAFARQPWLYEAIELAGRAAMDQGLEHQHDGDMNAARAAYEASGAALARALEVGRSDPLVHEAECERLRRLIVLELMTDSPHEDLYQSATSSCRRGLRADPDRVELWQTLAAVEWRWGEHQMIVNGEPEPPLRAGIEAARGALAIDPQSAIAFHHLATSWEILGEWQQRIGEDPQPALEQALEANRRALDLDPNLDTALSSLAGTLYVLGNHEGERGIDPLPRYREAADLLERAAEIDPIYAWSMNLAFLRRKEADALTQRGEDPSGALARALIAATAATEKNAEFFGTWLELAKVRLARAEAVAAGTTNRRREIAAGIVAIESAEVTKPGDPGVAEVAARLQQFE